MKEFGWEVNLFPMGRNGNLVNISPIPSHEHPPLESPIPLTSACPGGRVWAGTYDPRQSNIVKDVTSKLSHPMMVGVITPGEQCLRDRDRANFQKAIAQLSDGLSDLCHNLRKSVEIDDVS